MGPGPGPGSGWAASPHVRSGGGCGPARRIAGCRLGRECPGALGCLSALPWRETVRSCCTEYTKLFRHSFEMGDIDVSHSKQSRRQISVHDSSQLGETGKALLDETQLRPVISWRRYESGGGDCEIGTAQQSVDVTSQRKRRDKRGGSARSSGCPVSNISIAFFIWVSPGSGIETPRLGGGRAKSGHGTVLGLAKLGNLRLVLGTGSLIGDIATAPRFWGTRYALAPTTETHSQWNWCPQSCCFPHCRGLSLIYVLLRGFTSRAQAPSCCDPPTL